MKTEPNIMKRRLLHILKLLYEITDEQHPVNTFEILEYLEKQGIVANRKTLKGDLDLLVDFGVDIITIHSKPNRYFWGERSFEQAELKLLVDAVSSSRFISQKKSDELSRKLIALSSIHDQKNLKRHIYAVNRIKAGNESLMYIIDTVNEAISLKRKVSFQYTDYNADKEKILKNNGELYYISPYALFWNEDYYYVIANTDGHEGITVFRADRMKSINLLEEKAERMPGDFNVERYSYQVFEMYDEDKLVRVKLECHNRHMRYIIDRFGEAVETERATDKTFFAYADVSLSPTFYSWVFKFAGEIKIISPAEAVNDIKAMAGAVAEW